MNTSKNEPVDFMFKLRPDVITELLSAARLAETILSDLQDAADDNYSRMLAQAEAASE